MIDLVDKLEVYVGVSQYLMPGRWEGKRCLLSVLVLMSARDAQGPGLAE